MLPDSLVSELKGDEYQIMMVSTNYTIASDEINDQINKVDAIAKKYDAKSMVIGKLLVLRILSLLLIGFQDS